MEFALLLQRMSMWEDKYMQKYPTKTDKQVENAKIRHFRTELREMLSNLVYKKIKNMDICDDCSKEVEKNFRC